MFVVKVSRKARKSLDKMDEKIRQRILEALTILETTPVPTKEYDVLKLQGKENDYRIRISYVRVQYSVEWNENEIHVFDIERRTDHSYK